MMKHLLSISLVLALFPTATVLASDIPSDIADDFADGVQAYDGGRITVALEAW